MSEQPVPSNSKPEPGAGNPANSLRDVNAALFWFCLVWNFVYLAGSILAFFDEGYHIPHAATIIYLSLVGSYTLHNEVNRWNGKLLGASRRGHLIFYCWIVVASAMLLVQFVSKWRYVFHEEMLEFILGMFAIFAGNEVSKTLRSRNNNESGGTPAKP